LGATVSHLTGEQSLRPSPRGMQLVEAGTVVCRLPPISLPPLARRRARRRQSLHASTIHFSHVVFILVWLYKPISTST
jgi:hypothetical protein